MNAILSRYERLTTPQQQFEDIVICEYPFTANILISITHEFALLANIRN